MRRDLRLTTAICLPTEQVLRRIAVSQPSGCFPECYLTQCWFTPIGGEIYLIGLCPTSFLSSREGSSTVRDWDATVLRGVGVVAGE